MRIKWYAYWAVLVSGLLGLLYWKNSSNHKNKTWKWNAGKSVIEGIMLVLSAAFMPAFLVIYGGMWCTRRIEKPAIRAGVGFAVSIGLMLMLANFLEFVVVLGVFAIDLIATDFLAYWYEAKTKRKEIAA